VTDAPALDGLLQRALLVFNARALHAGAEAGVHIAAFLGGLADDVVKAAEASGQEAGRDYLAEAYRCLSLAADNPLRQSCREREALVNIACHGLAHAAIRQGPEGPASEEEVHELLTGLWTPSLLAWAELFPAYLDGVSPPCACGALGTRQVLVPAAGR
jgi:hypothetical protein